MASAPPGTSQHFRAQLAYPEGALMCTSASVYWALACLHRRKDALFARSLLDTVMEWAAKCHAAVGRKKQRVAMLQHEEVITAVGLPDAFSRESFNGHFLRTASADELAGFGRVVFMPEIEKALLPGTACVCTANRHTVAAYRDPEGVLWFFDSLPGVERRLPEGGLLPVFVEHLGAFDTCDLSCFARRHGR